MPDSAFHPAVAGWFREALGEPTEPQRRFFAETSARVDRASERWLAFERGRLAEIERALAARGVTLGVAPN